MVAPHAYELLQFLQRNTRPLHPIQCSLGRFTWEHSGAERPPGSKTIVLDGSAGSPAFLRVQVA
ncbi:hypothetical protein BS47DRAFT_1346990 [Hydnum rufescens UP504]|uniref:Uncharacterized protein n=1 Tax=Hydnum rufescens UP504 TaxID=1448309 RepID=A0A9P6DU49_9AGAM|nr:hypothetical protein BS47DRAFT_1346990 [Hydnum rufescens UP504]